MDKSKRPLDLILKCAVCSSQIKRQKHDFSSPDTDNISFVVPSNPIAKLETMGQEKDKLDSKQDTDENSRTESWVKGSTSFAVPPNPKPRALEKCKEESEADRDSDTESTTDTIVSVSSTDDDREVKTHIDLTMDELKPKVQNKLITNITAAGESYYTNLRSPRSPIGIVHPVRSPVQVSPGSSTNNQEASGTVRTENRDNPRNQLFDYYETNSGRPQGKGLVLILANFTHELKGYISDIQAITTFFGETLGYTVYGGSNTPETELNKYRELSREQMLDVLVKLKQHLNDAFSPPGYDRLMIFILSHGDEHGIKTCIRSDSGAVTPETNDAYVRPIRLKPQEISRMFCHDQVPSLRGQPKCIFVQACQGDTPLRAAADPMFPPTIGPIALGADTALFYSTTPGNLSYVCDTRGSWFIQETIAAMNTHYMREHLVDIMTKVTKAISRKYEAENQLCQLPEIITKLTEKLYLYIPH